MIVCCKRNGEKCFFVSLFALFMHGVSDIDQVSVSGISGDSVTLHTGVQKDQQERIRWYNNDNRIAEITRDKSVTCTDDECKERFRDRLELDQETGSLTIIDIRTTDAGVYILEVKNNNNNISEKNFIVAVHSVSAAERDEMKRKSVMEGVSVTFCPRVIKTSNDVMTWYFNDTLITEITGDQSKICSDDECKERFRDRLELDQETGSLTIMNIKTTDSGEYLLLISSSRYSILKRFSVNVSDSRGEPSALHQSSVGLTKIFVPIMVILLAVAAGVIYWCRFVKGKSKGQKYGVEIVLKVVGQSVILNTDTEVQTDDDIKWMFGDKKTVIAQIKEGTEEIRVHDEEEEEDTERFLDRLKLDPQTGSLTIMNTRTTDSGLYHLHITRSGKSSFKRFSVTISDSPETRIILFYPNEIAENKMPLMEKHPTSV
ncbi:uncharacterized protein LOC122327373 [Puntigrus tetrazona]|uniref:uncharacterized protein LOC122327373 n=1 Tax=Puntigrus tetrazona TaxID=1606681 RepID=UPI001C8ABD7B|nr:uncharacterized protein LOC122327373 [Puntigrus tetrazona]